MSNVLNRTIAIASGHEWNIIILAVAGMVALIIAAVVLLTFGITTFIGLIFLSYAGITLLLNRGSKFQDHMIILFVSIGAFFLALGFFGITFGVIDMSHLEVVQHLNKLIFP